MKNFFLISCLSWSVATSASTIHLIGNDKDGNEVVYLAESEMLKKEFLSVNEQKNQTAIAALEQITERSQFKLTKFSLGLGLEGEAGIGPWNLGLALKHRIFFAKGK